MAVNLTAGALLMLKNKEKQAMSLKPVVQVTDIELIGKKICGTGESYDYYEIMISDGSYCEIGKLSSYHLHMLIKSQKLQKGSIVRLTNFTCRRFYNRMKITIWGVMVILDKCDIVGDPKKLVVPEEASSNNARMTVEEDDVVGDCIEKLEKLGWKTQDPFLYDTALLMIGENGVNRKLWLKLLKPESCVKWVTTAGSKYGLLD